MDDDTSPEFMMTFVIEASKSNSLAYLTLYAHLYKKSIQSNYKLIKNNPI